MDIEGSWPDASSCDGVGEEGQGRAGHSSHHVTCCAAASSPAATVQSAFSQWRVKALHATQVVVAVGVGGRWWYQRAAGDDGDSDNQVRAKRRDEKRRNRRRSLTF